YYCARMGDYDGGFD
nr:immunoglobulin heavy chain junction region [Mus musculus]